ALRETMLIFAPMSAFNSVDLPTLGRPTIATRPQRLDSVMIYSLEWFGTPELTEGSAGSALGFCTTATGRESWDVLRVRGRLAGPAWDTCTACKAPWAASCSAARRLAPRPLTSTPSFGIAHSTSNSWLWAAPCVAVT